MRIFGKYILFISLSLLSLAFLTESASAAQNKPPKWKVHQRKEAERQYRKNQKKAYEYKKNHDLNHDGVIDAKDRLNWLRSKEGNYDEVLVSTENDDLVEAMDMDGDGDVESWEMEQFYESYDLNEDGVLDDYEIDQATN